MPVPVWHMTDASSFDSLQVVVVVVRDRHISTVRAYYCCVEVLQ